MGIGRESTPSTVRTGRPSASATARLTESAPEEVTRTRSEVAEAACRVTPVHENGRPPAPAIELRKVPCTAASSRAGWMPNPAASVSSGRTTSV